MKIFISWSKERSQEFAEALKDFFECVIQEVKPFLSTGDIGSGEQWFSKIMKNLSDTSHGIMCLTPENKDNPWIMFEAGAIVKGLDESRVHIILIGMESQDVSPPLSQFNMVRADKNGIKKLFTSVNENLINRLSVKTLDKTFESQWMEFEGKINSIEAKEMPDGKGVKRTGNEILLEILSTVRSFDTRIRDLEANELESIVSNSVRGSIIPHMSNPELLRFFKDQDIDPTTDKAARLMKKYGFSNQKIQDFLRWENRYWEISNDPGEQ